MRWPVTITVTGVRVQWNNSCDKFCRRNHIVNTLVMPKHMQFSSCKLNRWSGVWPISRADVHWNEYDSKVYYFARAQSTLQMFVPHIHTRPNSVPSDEWEIERKPIRPHVTEASIKHQQSLWRARFLFVLFGRLIFGWFFVAFFLFETKL